MKKSKILIYSSIILSYLLIINFISEFIIIQNVYPENFSSSISGGGSQKIGLGDSVSVSIKRNRPYGSILEENGNSKLKLLGLIPLPLKSDGINFIYFHLIFAAIIIYFLYRDLGKTGNDRKNVNNVMNEYNKPPSSNF